MIEFKKNNPGGGALSSSSVPMWRQVLSLFLSAVLVFQNLTCWMTPAWAEEFVGGDDATAEQVYTPEDESDEPEAQGESESDGNAPVDEGDSSVDNGITTGGPSDVSDEASDNQGVVSGDVTSDQGESADDFANGETDGSNGSADSSATNDGDTNSQEKTEGNAGSNNATSNEAVKSDAAADATKADSTKSDGTAEAAKANDAIDAEQPESNGESDIAALSLDGYDAGADPVEVTPASGNTVATYSYDKEGANTWNGEAITSGDELWATVTTVFNSDSKPTLAHPNVCYTFPAGIAVESQGSQTLFDSNNSVAGSWEISNNQVILRFSDTWLNEHQSEVTAYFKVRFGVSDKTSGDGGSTSFIFPGTSTTVTIPTKDGSVTGSKRAATNYDSATNSYTWIIQVTPNAQVHNLVITDAIGSGLDFVSGSFEMCDYNGNATGEAAPTVNIDGQVATINLGDRSAGTYYVKYATTLNSNATDGLKDNEEIKNVDNKASWTWGTTNPQTSTEVTASPIKVKYSMVSKSASGTNSDITWTVKLNNGDLKADMGNYTFTDTLTGEHHFIAGTQYTVTDASGNTIASGDVDADSSTLTFTLPANVGKQSLTVTYHTAMDDPTAAYATVKNTSTVTPPDDSYPSGTGEAGYTPTDERVYVGKSLVSKSDNGSEANWTSTVYFSNMASDTDVSKVSWTDTIVLSPYQNDFNPMVFSDVALKTSDGTALTEGTDYTVDTDGSAGTYKVTFIASSTVSGLVGKGDVVITYKTAPKDTSAVASAGSKFTNTSSVQVNGVTKGTATASYEVEASVPSVEKSSSAAQWDANQNGWVVTWTVNVNKAIVNYKQTAVVDTNGQPIVVKDTLPDGMTYVEGSASYQLSNAESYYSYQYTGTPTVTKNDDGTLSFSMATEGHGYNGDNKIYATLTYKTFVSASSIEPGQTMSFTNSADAETDNTKFPGGTSTTTITNDVLSKSHGAGTDEAHVKYTITVNPNALDLVEGDTVTLEDTMSATLSYTAGTFKVVDGNGNDVTSSCTLSTSNVSDDKGNEDTLLTITVPDATKLTITYECMPLGYIGQTVTISNSVKLSGQAGTTKSDSTTWKVQKSTAGADAVSYGLTVTKVDQADNTKKLAGAEFALYEVSASGDKGDVVATATTNSSGIATFGSQASPLEASKLYFVEETKAPAGYEISYTGTYIMFYPATATSQAVLDFESAYNAAVEAGHTPVVGTISIDADHTGPGLTFSVYDKKSTATSATLSVHKTVSGTDAGDKEFTFSLFKANSDGSKADEAALGTVTAKAGETKSFDAISFKEAGTFYYLISETGELGGGWTKGADVLATVTVTSTDDGLVASVSYSTATSDGEAADITNTYAACGSATISVHKTVNGGSEAKDGETFEFQLFNADENGQKKGLAVDTVTVAAGGTVSFNKLQFTKAGTYKYVVTEVGHNSDGWTAADDVVVTVTVEDKDSKGTLTTTVTYSNGTNAAEFDNTFQTSTAAQLCVSKTVVGGTEANADETFEFALYEADGYSVAEDGTVTGKQVGDTITVKAGGTASFADLTFSTTKDATDAGKTFDYVIHEVGHNDKGWTAAADVHASVKVTENGDRSLSAEVTYDGVKADAAQFTDTYTAKGDAAISVEKVVNGGSMAAEGETFTFDLYNAKQDAGGNWVSDGSAIQAGLQVKAGATGSFDALKFSTQDAEGATTVKAGDTLHYVVHETGHNTDGWVAADDVVAAVTFADDNDGTLSATVTYSNGSNAALFDDTYTEDATAQLEATKTLNGRDAVAGEFQFNVYAVDDQGNVGSTAVATATNAACADGTAGKVTFPTMTFGAAGTYKYQIEETVGSNGKVNYDQTKYTAVVTVTKDNQTGKLGASVKYYNADGSERTEVPSFTNTFTFDGVEATVQVSKKMSGADLADYTGKFEFQLWDQDGKQLYATTTNGADGIATFTRNFTTKGVYWYKIVEKAGDDQGMFYDSNSYYVKIWVEWDTADVNKLVIDSITYYQSDKTTEVQPGDVVFTNVKSTATAELKVSKTVNGGDIQANEKFTFDLYAADENGDKTGEAIASATVDGSTGSRVASFELQTFDEPGTYEYVIHETSDLGEGWTNDGDVRATVTVTRDEEGKALVSQVSYDRTDVDSDAAKFDNTYEDTATATIKVTKTVNGSSEAKQGEIFTFDLYSADDYTVAEDGTIDGEVLGHAEAQVGETVSFGDLQYTLADAGNTYEYVIHETGHSDKGWTAHDDVKAYVKVVQNEDRSISAEVTYGGGTETALFDDIYNASGEATISVTKTVNGSSEAKEGETFTFDLYQADENGQATGDKLGTVETACGGTASFDKLTFDKEGTYTYVIHETGHNTDGWTAADDVTATVTVNDNGDGTMSCKVKYSNGTNAALFDNAYEAKSASQTISVEKTVNGGPIKEGEKFTFTLVDEDGNQIGDAITADIDHSTVSFEELEFTEAGTYTYYVHETSDLGEGWTNDDDFKVTITVEEDNNRDMQVTKVEYGQRGYEKDGTVVAKFDNKHDDQAATATIKVDKTVNGVKNAQEQEKFTFVLQDSDGNQVGDEITVQGTGTAEFETLEFTEAGTYTYYVHETSDLGEGWVNAGDVKVTVEVVYKENGRDLEVKSVMYDGSSVDAAQFDNKHTTPDEPVKPTTPESDQPKTPETPTTPTTPSYGIAKTADETPVEGMALAGGAGVAMLGMGAFLALRSRKRDER